MKSYKVGFYGNVKQRKLIVVTVNANSLEEAKQKVSYQYAVEYIQFISEVH